MKAKIILAGFCALALLQGCASTTDRAFISYHRAIGDEYKTYVIDGKPRPDFSPLEIQVRQLSWKAANDLVSTLESKYGNDNRQPDFQSSLDSRNAGIP